MYFIPFYGQIFHCMNIPHVFIHSSVNPMIDYLQYAYIRNEKGEIATDLINKLKEDTISNFNFR